MINVWRDQLMDGTGSTKLGKERSVGLLPFALALSFLA